MKMKIKKLISLLKPNTPGYDMIGSAVLKLCVDFISEPLPCVICLDKRMFPDELINIANVLTMYKCGDFKLFNNSLCVKGFWKSCV